MMDKQKKHERNLRIAEKRVNRVLAALRAWGDLGAARYGFEGETVDRMGNEIVDEACRQRKRLQEQRTFCFSEADDGCDSATSDSENLSAE